MYNIVLIASNHTENDQCSSNKLYAIIESINPDVIFDELPPNVARKVYSDDYATHYVNSLLLNRLPPKENLEIKTIRLYLQNYDVQIVPVDTEVKSETPERKNEILQLWLHLYKNKKYSDLYKENERLTQQQGFDYLNSDKLLEYLTVKEALEKQIIEEDNQREKWLEIYNSFCEEQHDKRENAMLQNIYNYSKENLYNQAVFIVGAGHKKSLMEKIPKFQEQSEIKLNWNFY